MNVRPGVERAILALAVLVVVASGVPELFRSLWVDESTTDWIARSEGPGQVWYLAREYQTGSVYYFVPWLVMRAIPDASEALLRLPSMVAVLGAAAVLYRVGARLVSAEAGACMALLLVVQANVSDAAVNARSYGIGLLLVTASFLFLVRWLEAARWQDAVAFAACGGAAVNMHLLHVAVVGLQALYAVGSRRVPTWQIATAAAVGALMVSPAVSVFLTTVERRELYDFAGVPYRNKLVAALVPPAPLLVVPAAGALISRMATGSWGIDRPAGPWSRHAAGLVACWVGPIVLLFVISRASAGVFTSQYVIGAAPFAAAVLGVFLSHFGPPVRVATALAIVGAYLLDRPLPPQGIYRSQAAAVAQLGVGPETPVLYRTGLVEGNHVGWLEHPERRQYLLGSTNRYPLPGNVVLVPYDFGPGQEGYLREHALPALEHADRFLLVGVSPDRYEAWIRRELEPGFRIRFEGDGEILVGERGPAE